MITELGHLALITALVLSLFQAGFGFISSRDPRHPAAYVMPVLAPLCFILVALAFAALVHAYVVSDFSLLNVTANSHSFKPLLYRATGAWGNHEGSMLLWVLVLSIFSMVFSLTSRKIDAAFRFAVLGVQALISSAFALFILLTSNPFLRLIDPPMEGKDLNPLLQDIGLAVHPPLLYLGYVGFSLCYSFAIAALMQKQFNPDWAKWMRPWCLTAWVFLTLGVAMGSYWAYYELGWGGFWFWDPVENASFMPWLVGTMLLHSVLVTEKRGSLQKWTLLLSVFAFSLSLIGTFLVRSGVLTSVHAFATDPHRGLAILMLLIVFIGGALGLYAVRAPSLPAGTPVHPVSRESSLVLNNVLLSAATIAVLTGTLYPLLLEVLTGQKISVGPPYFNITFAWTMVPLLLLLPFGPFLAWKRADLSAAFVKIRWPLLGACALIAYTLSQSRQLLAALGVGLAAYVIFGALAEPLSRLKLFRVPFRESYDRARGFKLSTYGTLLGHLGMGVCLLGIVGATAFSSQQSLSLKIGEQATAGDAVLLFQNMTHQLGPNYIEDSAHFDVRVNGVRNGEVVSSKRFYPVRAVPTTEAGLYTRGVSQIYVSLAEWKDNVASVRIYNKPLVLLIWLGCIVIAFGGFLSFLRLQTKK